VSLHLHFLNHSFLRVEAEKDLEHELSDFLTFDVPGMEHMPAYRSGHWDGKARLYQMRYHTTYTGLALRVSRWAAERGIAYTIDPRLCITPRCTILDTSHLPATIIPRPYQLDGVSHALSVRRCVLIFPTGSGKSLIMYLLLRELLPEGRILIVVPTISLVKQFAKMLKSYGYDEPVYQIMAGISKDAEMPDVVVSTWQSIYKQPAKWFTQFSTILGDEAHTFKAKSLSEMMEKCITISNRIALTGTLDGAAVNEWLIEGLFGPTYTTTDTATLIEEGTLATVAIEQIILQHPSGKLAFNTEYRDEVNYLAGCRPRNVFLKNLALKLKGVTLILFTLVDTHARMIFEDLEMEVAAGRRVVFIHGATPADEREAVRSLAATATDIIIVATYGTFSTGIDVPEIDNIILGSPSKSRIRVLQTIGRGVRKTEKKVACTIYDIADRIPTPGRRFNFTLNHAQTRAEYYAQAKFPITQYRVTLPTA
jgi:superfamily II DNA or RNA helicase